LGISLSCPALVPAAAVAVVDGRDGRPPLAGLGAGVDGGVARRGGREDLARGREHEAAVARRAAVAAVARAPAVAARALRRVAAAEGHGRRRLLVVGRDLVRRQRRRQRHAAEEAGGQLPVRRRRAPVRRARDVQSPGLRRRRAPVEARVEGPGPRRVEGPGPPGVGGRRRGRGPLGADRQRRALERVEPLAQNVHLRPHGRQRLLERRGLRGDGRRRRRRRRVGRPPRVVVGQRAPRRRRAELAPARAVALALARRPRLDSVDVLRRQPGHARQARRAAVPTRQGLRVTQRLPFDDHRGQHGARVPPRRHARRDTPTSLRTLTQFRSAVSRPIWSFIVICLPSTCTLRALAEQ